MIQILGFKRLIILAALVAFNAVLGAGIYMYLVPDIDKKERQLRSLRSQVSTVQSDIERMKVEFDQFEAQHVQFEQHQKRGFFKAQNRRQAEKLFALIQEKSGISKASAAIKPAVLEKNDLAEKAEHKILKSEIEVNLEALDDVDVGHYIYLVKNFFPGHITVTSFKIERSAEVNGTVLRAIAGGKNLPLVKAKIKMVWRTMIPKDQLIEEEGGR